jgi:anaerobic selenocysteine-containing dehydrogenase
MYIMGENPAMSDPDGNHARDALAKLECLVVQDIFLTETAWHADVILPASAHAEKTGTFTNTNREVQLARQVIDPPGQARQDWELIQELATRLGLDWNYKAVSDVFAEMGTRPTNRATRSSSATASRPRAAAARSSRPGWCRRTSCPTRPIPWCSPPAACWSTGTPAP